MAKLLPLIGVAATLIIIYQGPSMMMLEDQSRFDLRKQFLAWKISLKFVAGLLSLNKTLRIGTKKAATD